jgi:hypothetical protein
MGMILLLALLSIILFIISSFFGKIIESTLGPTFNIIYTFISIGLIAVLVGLFFSRFSLVFPSIAIDKPIDLSDALELSRRYKMLLFVSVIIFPVFFGFLIGFIYGLVIGFLMGLISSKLSVLFSLLNLFITVFAIGFLSTAYEYIISQGIKSDYTNSKEPLKSLKIIENEMDTVIPKPLKEIEFFKDDNIFKVSIHETHNTTFDMLKSELISQYELLGFNENVIDRENKWMLKNPKNETAYIHLSYISNEYEIEAFNTEEPKIDFLN